MKRLLLAILLTGCAAAPANPWAFEPDFETTPEDYCSGDVLFEGDPSCEELRYCAIHGQLVYPSEWRDCDKFSPVRKENLP